MTCPFKHREEAEIQRQPIRIRNLALEGGGCQRHASAASARGRGRRLDGLCRPLVLLG